MTGKEAMRIIEQRHLTAPEAYELVHALFEAEALIDGGGLAGAAEFVRGWREAFKAIDRERDADAALVRTPPQKQGGSVHNEIARRFSGPEGDAAADSLKYTTWECEVCGNIVKPSELVIDPGDNYFYHEKSSGEICGRYVRVTVEKQGDTP